MPRLTRRSFLKTTGVAIVGAALAPRSWAQVAGANSDIRIGIAGLNGRGKDLIKDFDTLPGSRIVALCDVDSAVLDAAAKNLRDRGRTLETYADFRDLLAKGNVDAVAVATPNHWHALQAIWACQAGKDVYLEKPVSHNLWEGRKIIEAVAKYKRVVQVGSQCRSSTSLAEAVAWVRAGNIGKIISARGLCCKRRDSIGLTTGPTPPPPTVNYDLWLGPAADVPPHRKKFHYDWHWFWDYGNGDIGNQGVHQLDIARWFLGESGLAPRVLSVGGRLGYVDDAQTPNSLVAWHDYAKAPLIFEVRGLPTQAGSNRMDTYEGASIGVIVACEGGTVVVPSYTKAQVLDKSGQITKVFDGATNHAANFLEVVRSRKNADLHAPIIEGHVSSSLAHTGNISYRLGRALAPEAIKEQIKGNAVLSEAYGRLAENLAANNVDYAKTPLMLGAALEMDVAAERFKNNDDANKLLTAEQRKPFVIPEMV